MGNAAGFYSLQLSTDFLELPQTASEKRKAYWHYWKHDPFVGQSIDILTEIPITKMRLSKPKCKDKEKAKRILSYYNHMIEEMELMERIYEITFRYWLEGEVFIFAQDDTEGTGDKYRGWKSLRIFEPDQVKVTGTGYTGETFMEFIPSEEDRNAVQNADFDEFAKMRTEMMSEEMVKYIQEGQNLPMDTDPMEGSFCYRLARRPRGGGPGHSILERCLQTLLYRDKLRQAQTSIASRNMTPKRVVWGEDLDEVQLDNLQEMVDISMLSPDFSIVTNYQVNWEEYGVNDRLLDLSNEYDVTDRQLMIGLGVTMELLTGESTYSGSRLTLHVMNERFLRFRDTIRNYVEKQLFKPVALKMGFVEEDEWGNKIPIYPQLRFNRQALMDNQDAFSALFDLYNKGSLPVEFILDLFNIDADEVEEKILRDFGTVNDPNMNEALRSAFGDAGRQLAEQTDLIPHLASYFGLNYQEKKEDSRF
tara:strand:+ start:13616 stop:15046 length:1431 start_codon:yes stop_codon:yes gene_type:complete